MPPFGGDAAWMWIGDGRPRPPCFRRPFGTTTDGRLVAHVSSIAGVSHLDGEVLGHGPANGDVSPGFTWK